MFLPISLAMAADLPVQGLDVYRPAEPVALPAWFKGTVWLRDGAACKAAAVDDVARGWLAVQTCTGARELRCDRLVGVAGGWEDRGARCRRGVAGGLATLRPTEGEPVALVFADDEGLGFAPVLTLEASYTIAATRRQVCTPGSLQDLDKDAKKSGLREPEARAARLAEQGIVDGRRTCDISTGLQVHRGLGLGIVASGDAPAPVDCRTPCPPNPTLAALDTLRADLAGRQWYVAAAAERRVFATEAGCRAAPDTHPLLGTDDLCTTLGATVP